ncbi:MAG: type II secretion system F family protein [Candidatus Sericytochromatia bacterium]|nr:type II secretion system F family protein [Candidatus Sericytochromatia bacterium]
MHPWSLVLVTLSGSGLAWLLARPVPGIRAAERLLGERRSSPRSARSGARLGRSARTHVASALPDLLDLTAAAVGAGMGLDAAWALILEGPPAAPAHPLHDAMARYLAGIRLGASRAEALAEMATRTGLPEVGRLAAALLQADRHGIALQGVLQAQAAAIRATRRQRARKLALEAPVRLLFPLVFGMFPALLVVTLGPPALKLWEAFSRQAGS